MKKFSRIQKQQLIKHCDSNERILMHLYLNTLFQ